MSMRSRQFRLLKTLRLQVCQSMKPACCSNGTSSIVSKTAQTKNVKRGSAKPQRTSKQTTIGGASMNSSSSDLRKSSSITLNQWSSGYGAASQSSFPLVLFVSFIITEPRSNYSSYLYQSVCGLAACAMISCCCTYCPKCCANSVCC